jgi:hypothetical protein
MGWNLTPEERRIIEHTKRQGEMFYAEETPTEHKARLWRAVLIWIATSVAFVLLATFIVYIGGLF